MGSNLSNGLKFYLFNIIAAFKNDEEIEGGGAFTLFYAACAAAKGYTDNCCDRLYRELQELHPNASPETEKLLEMSKNNKERLTSLAEGYLRAAHPELIAHDQARINKYG